MLDVEELQALVSGQRYLESDINFGCEKTHGVGFFYAAMQHCNFADTHEKPLRLDVRSAGGENLQTSLFHLTAFLH